MPYREELKAKRKSSLIVVCTLGLTALFIKNDIQNVGYSIIDK